MKMDKARNITKLCGNIFIKVMYIILLLIDMRIHAHNFKYQL